MEFLHSPNAWRSASIVGRLAIFDTLSPSELMLAVFQGSRTPFITRMLLVQIAVRYTGRSVVWLK